MKDGLFQQGTLLGNYEFVDLGLSVKNRTSLEIIMPGAVMKSYIVKLFLKTYLIPSVAPKAFFNTSPSSK